MLILFVMGILIVGVVLMTNIMSIFFPFFQQLGTITNYNRSYYGAITSIERGLLVLKNHQPGFEGSGGWIKQNSFGPFSDTGNRQTFGIISRPNNSMNWQIKSRTSSNIIPIAGESNIDSDYLVGSEGEKNIGFNKLTYANPRGVSLFGSSLSNLERIYLYYDKTSDVTQYYTGVKSENLENIKPNDIKINISTPKLKNNFGYLDTNQDIDGDGTTDDALVSRSLAGKKDGENFSIKQIQNFGQGDDGTVKVNLGDTAIREADINKMVDPMPGNLNSNNALIFGNSYKSIFPKTDAFIQDSTNLLPKYHNINPVNSALSGSSFTQIFQNESIKNLTLNLGLINIPKADSGIYPFLKYKVQFPSNSVVPNAYYYIKGNGNVGANDVQILIKKPVSDTSIFSDFSIIF